MWLQLDSNIISLAVAAATHIFVITPPALAVQLVELPVDSRVRVVEIRGSGKHHRRILDMGFVPGAEVRIIRKAVLDDLAEYRVENTVVALQQKEASSFLVGEL